MPESIRDEEPPSEFSSACWRRPGGQARGAPSRAAEGRAPPPPPPGAGAGNEVWTVDFKGWWQCADKRRCEPLTIRDAHSRYLLCADPLELKDRAGARAVRARLRVIRPAANHPHGQRGALRERQWPAGPFRAVGLVAGAGHRAGPHRSGTPRPERLPRTHAPRHQPGGAGGGRAGDLESQRAALAVWREEYNQVRPHEALGYRTPAQVYTPSTRRCEGTPDQLALS